MAKEAIKMVGMKYRKAEKADCKAVYDLICDMEAKLLPVEEFRGIFEAQCDDPNYYCLLLEITDADGCCDTAVAEKGKVIGECNLRFEYQLHHAGRIAEVMEYAIDAEYRNRGIGSEMLSEAFEIARENGCEQIEVACNQLRKDTHRFYLRNGMHNFHFKFSYPLTGEDSAENVLGR